MVTYSSILAWEIPWMEEPGQLQSMLQRVRHEWAHIHYSHLGKSLMTSSSLKGCFNVWRDNFLSILLLRDVQVKHRDAPNCRLGPIGRWMESPMAWCELVCLLHFPYMLVISHYLMSTRWVQGTLPGARESPQPPKPIFKAEQYFHVTIQGRTYFHGKIGKVELAASWVNNESGRDRSLWV